MALTITLAIARTITPLAPGVILQRPRRPDLVARNLLLLHMIPQHAQQHLLERKDALLVERVQRPATLKDTAGEVLLHVLAQRKVLVDDFAVEVCHAHVRLGRRVRRVQFVDVVFLARRGCGRRDAAHHVHEARARVGREVARREDVRGGAAGEAGVVERPRG